MESALKILAIGEVMLEFSKKNNGDFQQSYAGDVYNTLYYLARSPQFDCALYTAVGNDIYSQQLLNRISENNISTEFIFQHSQKQLGLYLIQNDQAGERSFSYYRNDSAATEMLTFLTSEFEQSIVTNQVIYLSGISLAILAQPAQQQLIQFLQKCSQQGVQIYFDNNYRERLWTNAQQAQQLFEQLHTIADVLFVTFDDEQKCFGDSNLEATFKRYQDRKGITVIKNSEAPVCVLSANHCQQYPVPFVESIIDTTGAGDTFNAGFMQQYLQTRHIENSCANGADLAGQVIQHRGAIISTFAKEAVTEMSS